MLRSGGGLHDYYLRSWPNLWSVISVVIVVAGVKGINNAGPAESALAAAKAEVASRGLAVTVTRLYYALIVAQRRYATVQQAAQQAARFFDISQQQERVGQVAHADVVKAQIQMLQQQQPEERIEHERQERQRPAKHQEDEPEDEAVEYAHDRFSTDDSIIAAASAGATKSQPVDVNAAVPPLAFTFP